MKEHPILFSAPMVRALLAGQKTQTRRIVKPNPDIAVAGTIGSSGVCARFTPDDERLGRLGESIACPYGQHGDRLWGREAWRASSAHDDLPPRDIPTGDAVEYGADAERILTGKLRPSMFMPRWASRITLEIVSVRVERLQDISDRGQPNDCIAEGMFSSDYAATKSDWLERGFSSIEKCRYHDLWEQLNGAGSWAANPWVWVVEFRRIKP